MTKIKLTIVCSLEKELTEYDKEMNTQEILQSMTEELCDSPVGQHVEENKGFQIKDY